MCVCVCRDVWMGVCVCRDVWVYVCVCVNAIQYVITYYILFRILYRAHHIH